jgi:predicted HicB family RNase H-like nuclease
VFFGKIELIDDLVTFEANSACELETNFHNAVDEYLQTCKELNRNPQKTYKGVFNVRIDPKLHQKLHQEALKAGMSLNAFVQSILSSKASMA